MLMTTYHPLMINERTMTMMTTAYDVILTDSSVLFAQSWYNRPASQGLIELPAPIKGCRDLTNKEIYFEATSSESQEKIDVANLAPPVQHSSMIFPPFQRGSSASPLQRGSKYPHP